MKKMLNKRSLYISGILVFSSVYLLFIITSGYWSDDYFLWDLRGRMRVEHISLCDMILSRIKGHVLRGRFFPITNILGENLAYLLPLKIYKIYLMALVIACELSCFHALSVITDNVDFAFLSTISSVILFGIFPDYAHSVFLSFGGNVLVALVLCFCALSFWIRYLRSGNKKTELLFLIFFLCSLLTYEVAYTFIVVYLLSAYIEKGTIKSALIASIRMLAMFLVAVAIYFYIKIVITTDAYAGTTFSFQIKPIIHGFFVSITAALPFFSWLTRGGVGKNITDFADSILTIAPQLIILVSVFLALLLLYTHSRKSDQGLQTEKIIGEGYMPSIFDCNKVKLELLLTGISYIVFPAFLMAVSEKYQRLSWGLGYLVVIFQYFGYGILCAYCFEKLLLLFCKKRKWIYLLFSVYAIVLIVVNQNNSYYNIAVRENVNAVEPIPASRIDLIKAFAQSDLLSEKAGQGVFLCTDKTECYYLSNFADYDFVYPDMDNEAFDRGNTILSGSKGEKIQRIKRYDQYIVMGTAVKNEENMIDLNYSRSNKEVSGYRFFDISKQNHPTHTGIALKMGIKSLSCS